MRKFVYITLLGLLTLFLGGCQREQQSESEVPLRFETVAVSIGQDNGNVADSPETRSLITVEAENFQDAYLFAFDATTKEILSYPEHAGDLEGSKPVAIYTTAKTFNWALPIGHAMDVWVVVNAGDAFTDFLNDCLGDSSLVEDDLYGTNMMFRCENGTQLKALETDGPGIPMSGRMDNVTLASVNDGLSVTVKRLFAKYNIYFDMSGYTSQGYVVKSTYLMSSKSNTEVPFFWNGNYQQTDPSKLATVDRSTEADLITLDNGGQVTLYFLENCQGDKSGAESWRTVYKDLGASAVSKCSYMEVGVNVSKVSTGEDVSFFHRIYLGKTDMKSNFDVERNLFKTIKLYLSPMDPDVPGGVSGDIFAFTNTNSLSVAPGESISIPFETTISSRDELRYIVEKSGVSSSDLKNGQFTLSPKQSGDSYRYNSTDVPFVGTLTLTADAGANEGTLDVTGGKNLAALSEKVSSTVKVSIMEPTVLNVAYEIQKLGSYVNEWSKIRLPEASSDSPVVVSITKNGRQSPFCTLSCGGSNSSAGYDYWGLAWDASSKVLYASGYETENIIILEQEGKETTVIDYNLRKPVLGPDVTEMSGNASVSYEDGTAHVILDDTGSDSYIRIVPFDPVTQTKISGETFAIPSIVNSNIYYAFENGSLDTNV
ncbi:MAG: DUF4906 domain-containing protein, partial [Bacteroidales bacterium]|nr:DUF4906 domain-containing protein [Bacteroidales bacterium]